MTYTDDSLPLVAVVRGPSSQATTTYTHDTLSRRLTRLRFVGPQSTDLRYVYDPAGNILSLTEVESSALGGTIPTRTYSYDSLHRLRQSQYRRANGTLFAQYDYTYLANENLFWSSEVGGMLTYGDPAHPYAPTSVNGTEGPITYVYDADGLPLWLGESQSATWDPLGRLTLLGGTPSLELRYHLDAGGRAAKIVSGAPADSKLYFDGLEIQGEVGHLNPQTPVNPAPQSAFTHFELGRHRLARVKSPISWPSRSLDLANSRTEYYVPDHIGSTYLAGVFGSSYRRIVDAPFGRSAFQYSNGTFDTPYRFTGAERDQTGLYLVGARYLNPPAGKWLSPDPLFIWSPSASLESPREQNLYAYARNNPVRLTDPTGLSTDLGIELRATHPNHPSPPPASLGGMTFGQFWHALNEAILPGYKSMNVVERIASLGQGLVAGKLVETGARLIVNAFQRIQAGTTAAANATLRVQTGVRAGGSGRYGQLKEPRKAPSRIRVTRLIGTSHGRAPS